VSEAAASEPPEISQRDLKTRAGEIMDAVESGESFILTRSGQRIATVTPISRRKTFVTRSRVAQVFKGAPVLDDEKFRSDVSSAFDDDFDPFSHGE
jgi:prevent-host-death family protein